MDELQVLGQRVGRKRRRRGLTIEALALISGVHKNTVLNLEHGKSVQVITVFRVAKALGTRADLLLAPSRSRLRRRDRGLESSEPSRGGE